MDNQEKVNETVKVKKTPEKYLLRAKLYYEENKQEIRMVRSDFKHGGQPFGHKKTAPDRTSRRGG